MADEKKTEERLAEKENKVNMPVNEMTEEELENGPNRLQQIKESVLGLISGVYGCPVDSNLFGTNPAGSSFGMGMMSGPTNNQPVNDENN